MSLLFAQTASGRGNFSGSIHIFDGNFSQYRRIYFPPGIGAINRQSSTVRFGNRLYITGGYTGNLIIDEHFRCSRQGILPPDEPPDVSAGAGSQAQIGYLRYYDEVTGERSPLSGGTSFTGNDTRTWINLPTVVPGEEVALEGTATIAAGVVTGSTSANYDVLRPGDKIARESDQTRWGRVRSLTNQTSFVIDDTTLTAVVAEPLVAKIISRVSHIELWVSVDGSLPRFVLRVRLGVGSVTETTPVLSLGEAETEPFEAMPVGSMNVIYNKRQIIAGVEGHPDTVYLSVINYPERTEGLKFRTPYGETIVGLFKHGDYVVVLCPNSSYRLQGLSDDDYVLDVLDPDVGGLGHRTNVRVKGRTFVPNADGWNVFNGAFHPVIPTRETEWQKRVEFNPTAYEQGFATVNKSDKTIQFYPNVDYLHSTVQPDPVLVGDYTSVGSDGSGGVTPPEWVNDTNTTPGASNTAKVTFAQYLKVGGQKVGKFYRGDETGKIWVEDDETALHCDAIIVLPALNFADPGGNIREGKMLIRAWSYIRAEQSEVTLNLWPGDEYACPTPRDIYNQDGFEGTDIVDPVWSDTVGDSYLESTNGDGKPIVYAPKITHEHPVIRKSGRCHTLEYVFEAALRVEFYGCSLIVGPGEISRYPTLLHDVPA